MKDKDQEVSQYDTNEGVIRDTVSSTVDQPDRGHCGPADASHDLERDCPDTPSKPLFISIKNFSSFQVDKNKKPLAGPQQWIKDATHKEDDYQYSQLTMAQRYILDGLRRIRGADGKNPHNNPKYIARRLDILPRERAHIAQAIRTLYALGLVSLVESTEEAPRIDKSREEKRKEVEVEESATVADEQTETEVPSVPTPVIPVPEKSTPISTPPQKPLSELTDQEQGYRLCEIYQGYLRDIDPGYRVPGDWKSEWPSVFRLLMCRRKAVEIAACLKFWYKQSDSDFWRTKILSIDSLERNMDTMFLQYAAEKAKKPRKNKGNANLAECLTNPESVKETMRRANRKGKI